MFLHMDKVVNYFYGFRSNVVEAQGVANTGYNAISALNTTIRAAVPDPAGIERYQNCTDRVRSGPASLSPWSSLVLVLLLCGRLIIC